MHSTKTLRRVVSTQPVNLIMISVADLAAYRLKADYDGVHAGHPFDMGALL
jgi:hypothetical protein